MTELTIPSPIGIRIANMIEIHGNSTGFDGGVFIASCDKSVPACLMGLARLNMPPSSLRGRHGSRTRPADSEQIGAYSANVPARRNYRKKSLPIINRMHALCGACLFMGTASTMQIIWRKRWDASRFSATARHLPGVKGDGL